MASCGSIRGRAGPTRWRRASGRYPTCVPWSCGASGGRRILPAVAQILSFLVDYGMTLEEAFHQPRLDMSGDGTVTLDSRLPPAVADALAARFPVLRAPVSVYPV